MISPGSLKERRTRQRLRRRVIWGRSLACQADSFLALLATSRYGGAEPAGWQGKLPVGQDQIMIDKINWSLCVNDGRTSLRDAEVRRGVTLSLSGSVWRALELTGKSLAR